MSLKKGFKKFTVYLVIVTYSELQVNVWFAGTGMLPWYIREPTLSFCDLSSLGLVAVGDLFLCDTQREFLVS